MISVGENKAVICKGNYYPAALFKGDKKLAGYSVEEFQGTGSVILENCYNDRLYAPIVQGKNILDVNRWFPDNVNNEGGITFSTEDLKTVNSSPVKGIYKENTRYTISGDYEITDADDNITWIVIKHTDGTYDRRYSVFNATALTGDKSGSFSITSQKEKSIDLINFASYSSATRSINVKLTNLQIEEGTKKTDYELPCTDAIVRITSVENADKEHSVSLENGILTEEIPTFKGTTVLEIESDIAATISGKYKRKEE